MLKRILTLLVLAVLSGQCLNAQITTSSITGTAKNSNGEALVGATITATHTPSGTRYTTVSQQGGQFNISNMRVGGPYEVAISYVGLKSKEFTDITLKLGEAYALDAVLETSAAALESIVVSTIGRNSILNSKRTGAITNVGRRELERLPTITRTLSDFTRLTPQSNGPAVGGGNYRQNYITVDGSDFNNAFGIGGNLPAGGAPISIDALEEFSINITPFDVRQSNFIGSSLNAVTRSGTNNFQGSAYYYFRSEKQQGNKVGKEQFLKQRRDYKQIGARVGGPIIKNKLFYFLSYEDEKDVRPGQQKFAATSSAPFGSASNIARPTVAELDAISAYLKSKYEYETGPYQGYDFAFPRTKYLARIDWNISDHHRLNIRYNNVQSKSPSFVSTSNGSAGTLANNIGNRQDINALHFKNSNYYQENNFYSISAELNSTFGKVANILRISRNNQNEPRSSDSKVFPFVDVLKDGLYFTSFGYEPFSYGNLRDVLIYSAFDNLTWTSGKHNFLVGGQFDWTNTKNGFQPYGTSYYRFASWDDFVNGVKPLDFTLTYSLLPNFQQAYPTFKFMQYALYGQDEIALNKDFKLTVGLRADLTTYPNVTEVKENPLVSTLTFAKGIKINTGNLPKPAVSFSPRIGFNWDVNGDRSYQIRGGTGIFTGRVPFVWIVGQSGNSGMLQVTQNFNGQANTPGPFNPDPAAYRPATVPQAGTVIPSTITAFSEDFKNPQSWKTSLGIDRKIAGGWVGTLEFIYNRDTRVLYSKNVNLVDPQPLNISGYPDNRLIYPSSNAQKYINKLTSTGQPSSSATNAFSAILSDNENKGYYFSATAKLEKQFSGGFFGQIAYTYTLASNLYEGNGDQPVNTWNLINSINGPNTPSLGIPGYVVPHRVIGAISYKKEYFKHLATTISLFYEGANQGRFSYVYSGDLNRDGGFNNDLIYIPKDPSEITFGNGTNSTGTAANVVIGGVTYTPQQQSDLFFKYLEQDKYLRKYKGQYAERNGVLFPWRNQFDIKFVQDIFKTVAGRRNTLQFSLDIFNFANLLNSRWGITQTQNAGGGQILILQNASSLTPGGTTKPIFRLATDRNKPISETFRDNLSLSSTYYMQFGLRYIFGQ